MKNSQYLALLRGINVGGNNVIKMADLKTALDKAGFQNVITYIQSGNVLFSSSETNKDTLTKKVESTLAKRFDYQSRPVVISRSQLKQIINSAPKGFGTRPAHYRYDVIFLKSPLTAATAFKSIKTKEGVDYVTTGPGVLYFSRLIKKATQSYMSKIVLTPIYKDLTIRNWNTTTKLLTLMEAGIK
jgi:uncharacterized protein (DUF1697 family)